MKLQVLQEDLSKILTIASRFTSTRAQLPILGNILFSASKTKLLIASTNLEVSIAISIGAKVEKSGEIAVPAKVITDLVNNLSLGQITLETEKEKLKIKASDFSSTVSSMNSSDFPALPKSLDKKVIEIDKNILINSLTQCTFAASIDETRPILTGLLFIFEKNRLTIVATDGFRLSQKHIPLTKNYSSQKIILPKTTLSELIKLAGEEENISFSFKDSENQSIFKVGRSILSSRILQGEFPDYERIIPSRSSLHVFVDKEELLRAIKLASVFARESANVVNLTIQSSSVSITAESQHSGEQKGKIDAKVEGESLPKGGFSINYNYRFLEDFLNSVEGEEIKMSFSAPSAPGIFRDTKDKDYLHLIMPVKLQS